MWTGLQNSAPGGEWDLVTDAATDISGPSLVGQFASDTEGPAATHDFTLVKRLLRDELADILGRRPAEAAERYRKSVKIAMRWIKNYTDLDFRSLGSYTRKDLDAIAAAPDPF